MSEVIIRSELKPGDIGYITYLHGKLYSEEFGYNFTFEAYVGEPLSQFAKRENSRERLWVVEYKGQITGCIAICEVSESVAQLRWFLIEPKLRGMGVGKRLIDDALSFVKEKSYSKVDLWTVKGLEAARKIYLNNGFSLAEEVIHNTWGSERTEQKYSLTI
ncbi:GNAT family N-acetyltransferase [Microbulbifer sp. SSSA002]|uniref:GNAT family N-acetyltransferase n=1 Tax=unclassified Microbulbifer TaxID=2619833 RepID=UPI00403A3862